MARQRSHLFHMGWPLVLSFWLRQAFAWVDRVYARELPDLDAAQAAITLALPFEFLMIACWVGVSNGLTARLAPAIAQGRGEWIDQQRRVAFRTIWWLIGLFLVVTAGIWFFGAAMSPDPDVQRDFRIYTSVLVGGSAFTLFWSIWPDSVVKAHQDTRTTMWAGFISSGTNVVLNSVFTFVFGWGLFGIAFSTVLGRLGGLYYAWDRAAVHERKRLAGDAYREPGREAAPYRELLKIAVPSGMTYVLLAAEGFALNAIVQRIEPGTDGIAAWGIVDSSMRFLVMPPVALGVALLPLAGRLRGQGRLADLSAEVRSGLIALWAYVLLAVLPVVWFFGRPLAASLLEGLGAVERAAEALPLVALLIAAQVPLLFLRPLFDALGRPKLGLALSAVRSLALAVPLAATFGLHPQWLGLTGLAAPLEGFILGLSIASGTASLLTLLALKRLPLGARTGTGSAETQKD